MIFLLNNNFRKYTQIKNNKNIVREKRKTRKGLKKKFFSRSLRFSRTKFLIFFYLRVFALTCRDSTNVADSWMRKSDH
jgi:hypothetical protein